MGALISPLPFQPYKRVDGLQKKAENKKKGGKQKHFGLDLLSGFRLVRSWLALKVSNLGRRPGIHDFSRSRENHHETLASLFGKRCALENIVCRNMQPRNLGCDKRRIHYVGLVTPRIQFPPKENTVPMTLMISWFSDITFSNLVVSMPLDFLATLKYLSTNWLQSTSSNSVRPWPTSSFCSISKSFPFLLFFDNKMKPNSHPEAGIQTSAHAVLT